MKKIAVFLGTGFEEIEALTVVDICRRAEIITSMVSISDKLEVESAHGIVVTADVLYDQVDFQSLDMIVLPGGKLGTENLEAHTKLMEQVEYFYKNGTYLAAICAAPSILGHKGMLQGREACSYPSFEEHLEGATVLQAPVVLSDHIITSRGMGCSIPFALKIVELLCSRERAASLAEEIIFNG